MKKEFNKQIEALRGFAALSVFIYHLISNAEFNLGYEIRDHFFPYAPPGHLMVMIFFMLSGYVIGITNPEGALFNPSLYIGKRLLRLYPIYLISILLTALLFHQEVNIFLGNLFFVQNAWVDNLKKNQALWSINHEVVYYLLVIPILLFRWNVKRILLAIGLLLCFSFWISPFYTILEAYLVGFSFWLIGFWLSRQEVSWQASPNQLLSALVFLLGADYLDTLSVLLRYIPILHGSGKYLQGLVSGGDYSLLPICLYAMLLFTGINKRLCMFFFYLVYASSFAHLGYLLISGSFFKTQVFILPAFFVLLSFALFYATTFKVNLSFFIWLGGLSYAIYVIHTPILYAFEYIPFWGGTTLFFFVRMLIIVPLVIGLSYILEKKFQPFIKRMFTVPVKVSNV